MLAIWQKHKTDFIFEYLSDRFSTNTNYSALISELNKLNSPPPASKIKTLLENWGKTFGVKYVASPYGNSPDRRIPQQFVVKYELDSDLDWGTLFFRQLIPNCNLAVFKLTRWFLNNSGGTFIRRYFYVDGVADCFDNRIEIKKPKSVNNKPYDPNSKIWMIEFKEEWSKLVENGVDNPQLFVEMLQDFIFHETFVCERWFRDSDAHFVIVDLPDGNYFLSRDTLVIY